jgi:hypothetical protein
MKLIICPIHHPDVPATFVGGPDGPIEVSLTSSVLLMQLTDTTGIESIFSPDAVRPGIIALKERLAPLRAAVSKAVASRSKTEWDSVAATIMSVTSITLASELVSAETLAGMAGSFAQFGEKVKALQCLESDDDTLRDLDAVVRAVNHFQSTVCLLLAVAGGQPSPKDVHQVYTEPQARST